MQIKFMVFFDVFGIFVILFLETDWLRTQPSFCMLLYSYTYHWFVDPQEQWWRSDKDTIFWILHMFGIFYCNLDSIFFFFFFNCLSSRIEWFCNVLVHKLFVPLSSLFNPSIHCHSRCIYNNQDTIQERKYHLELHGRYFLSYL